MPQRSLIRHLAAQRDMAEATAWLVEHAGNDVATRFVDTLEATFTQLLDFPHLGRPWPVTNPELSDLRRLVLPSSVPFSVFYRPTESTLEVVRVLHHARHIPPLLEDL